MNNKIDKYFKNNLENATWTPSNNVWDKIEQSGVIGEDKGFILPIYAKIAVAAILTIGMFSAALIWMNQPNQTPDFVHQDSLYIGEDTSQTIQPTIEQDAAPASKDSTDDANKDVEEDDNQEDIRQGKPETVAPQRLPRSIENQRKINSRKRTSSAEEKIGVQEQRAILAYQNLAPLDSDLKTNKIIRKTSYEATSMALELAADPHKLEYRSTLDMFEEAGYVDRERKDPLSNDDNTITEKLFQFAGEKLSTFADASGLSFQRLSKVDEIEIVY